MTSFTSYATQMQRIKCKNNNTRYKNVDDVLPDLDLENLSLQIPTSLTNSQASITSLPESEDDTPSPYHLNQTPIDMDSEYVKLKILQ